MNIEREIDKLLKTGKYSDPRLGSLGKTFLREKNIRNEALPRYGIISDNKDPLYLGRVRVSCDLISPGTITPWIPMIRSYSQKNTGIWYLPDIGTQVLLGFIANDTAKPFVFGCIYNLTSPSPKHSAKNSSQSILIQTKNHRIEMIDEDAKESIIINTMKGQIRLDVSKENGIRIINELGDINIICRKFKIEAEENILIQTEKETTIQSKETVTFNAKKKTIIQNDKEVKIKAQCIKLQGSQGVSSEGKQLAAEGDKVMGVDIHNMQVPAGFSTVEIPLPHPYIGKLTDKLSKDVKINNHNAATKGSKSKHDDPLHMQLPGTITFTKTPNKEGEVSGGTAKKVKINGKEAAVIGSTVTSCNDTGMKDNSAILAPGVSMPMPMIINPSNTVSYQLERAENKTKQPELTTVKWDKTQVKEGEELKLSAQVKDIDDGNMITFQVWRAEQDPNSHVSYWKYSSMIKGGSAETIWQYNSSSSAETIPETDPKFFFSAHSAWCPFKKSGNATIKLKRPCLSNPAWKDKNGNTTSKGIVGEVIKLCVDCNDDMNEGTGVSFIIYDSDKKKIHESSGTKCGGKAETEWTYHYQHDSENPLTEKPKFMFTAKALHSSEVQSGTIEIGMTYRIIGKMHNGKSVAEAECIVHLSGNKSIKKTSNINGEIIIEDTIPGSVLMLEYTDKENETQTIDVKEDLRHEHSDNI
jgi:uncharacterized Zn-binding protein involved in type VI secretion